MNKDSMLAHAEQLYPLVAHICQALHRQPELGFLEQFACGLLTETLSAHGFTVETPCAGLSTAFLARLHNGDGPTAGLLCEYDALPGLGHACGHNLIAASSVGAACALAADRAGWSGTLVVVGTPSEEGAGGGKIRMLEAGVLAELDCAFMIHPGPQTILKDRTLAISSRSYTFHGVSAHAAAAQETGRNALEAAIHTFNGVNSLRGHLKREVNIHGIITEGGTAPNIIPDRAAATFGIRAKTAAELTDAVTRVDLCAKGAALMTGCTVDIAPIGLNYSELIPNDTLLEVFARQLEAVGVPIDVHEVPEGFASTDVGNLSQRMPAVQVMLGIGTDAMPHTAAFAAACGTPAGAEAALTAAKVLALTAAELFGRPSLVEEAKAEQQRKV